MEILLKENIQLNRLDILQLYESVNWTAYTKDPDTLYKAIENSFYILTA